MDKKYWVPAIERANEVLHLLAAEPSKLRLIDLSKRLSVNKSSMFSLLNTMEILGWIVKEKGDTYTLGPAIGGWSASYFRQYSILQSFYQEAETSGARLNVPIQLSVIDGSNIIYLAKQESASHFRLATDPGMRFPAHATAMGKVLLSSFTEENLLKLYPGQVLEQKTEHTVKDVEQLLEQLKQIKAAGYAVDQQEAMLGFCCIAAPVVNMENQIVAAVSMTILANEWNENDEKLRTEIKDLAQRLSHSSVSHQIK